MFCFRASTKLRSDDTAGFFRLSELHYQLGEAEEALNEVRECLRLDPEHKECYPFYKKIKKVAKFVGKVMHYLYCAMRISLTRHYHDQRHRKSLRTSNSGRIASTMPRNC